MIGRTNRSGLWLLTVLALAAAFGCMTRSARAEEDKTAQVEKLFREGVDLYQQGKYAESQKRLHDLLALDPRKELAARLVDEAGTRIITRMMADVRMGNEPTYVWELYRKYYVAKLADKERMAKMAARLVDLQTTESERAQLYREFAELGHYAVPILAPYLKDANHEDFRTYARIAIGRMGPKAVLPLIELVNHSDTLMRENAILVLSDIQPLDARMIPALKTRLEDPQEKETVKHLAGKVLEKVTGLPSASWKSAAEYYYDQANRYYLDRAGVAEEGEEVDGMVWHLNADGELIAVRYPLWAWNDQMAEAVTLRGLSGNPEFAAFYPLWACVQAAQYTEVKDLLDISKEQPAMNSFSSEEKKEIEDWDKKLVNSRRLAAAVGKEYMNAALAKVLADLKKYPGHSRLPSTGVFLARELALLDPAGELLTPPPEVVITMKPNHEPVTVNQANVPVLIKNLNATVELRVKPSSLEIAVLSVPVANGKDQKGQKDKKDEAVSAPVVETVPQPVVSASALVNGLDCLDMSIQYACALSLASIDRFPSKWIGSDKVAAKLGRGVSEDKSLQILLVEENLNVANEERGRLEKLGYGVSLASSGRDALVQACSFPPKDIVVAAENLRRDLNTEQMLEEMRADVRTRYLPVGVLHVRDQRNLIQARFGSEMPLVERENDGNDLKVQIEAVAAKRQTESVPKRQAHEVSRQCAEALAALRCENTYLDVNAAVPNAIGALINRPDDVRIPCAVFLGHAEGGKDKAKAAEALKTVFLDAQNTVELRRAALRSLGRVQKDGLEEVCVKAQAESDQELKDIGAESFGQKSRQNKAILSLISNERIDKDKKEK